MGSSRQGRNSAGESPAVSVARVGHVATSHLGMGTEQSLARQRLEAVDLLGEASAGIISCT